jgi:hypothetical protein
MMAMTPEEVQDCMRTLRSMVQGLGVGDTDTDKTFDGELNSLELAFPDNPHVAAIRGHFNQLLQESGAMRDRSRLSLGIAIGEFQRFV